MIISFGSSVFEYKARGMINIYKFNFALLTLFGTFDPQKKYDFYVISVVINLTRC